MGPVSAEVEINVPRERAFAYLADLANRPSFTDHFISDLRLSRIASAGVGAAARFRFGAPLQPVWMGTQIEEAESPHRILERGRGGRVNRLPSTTLWELTEGPGALTTVRVSYWTSPSNPVDRIIELLSGSSLWYRRGWERALRRLREILEAGGSENSRVTVAGGNRHATGVP